jgi:hypothetical protein
MNNSNSKALLTYLEEQKEQTKSSLRSQNHTNYYWKSFNYLKDDDLKNLTNDQVDFFITNGENRSEELKDRLEWLEVQIENVKFSERLGRIKNNKNK